MDLRTIEQKASDEWNAIAKFVGQHPKTALVIFVLIVVAAAYLGHRI